MTTTTEIKGMSVKIGTPARELGSDEIAVHPQDVVIAANALLEVIAAYSEQGRSVEVEQMALNRLQHNLEGI